MSFAADTAGTGNGVPAVSVLRKILCIYEEQKLSDLEINGKKMPDVKNKNDIIMQH